MKKKTTINNKFHQMNKIKQINNKDIIIKIKQTNKINLKGFHQLIQKICRFNKKNKIKMNNLITISKLMIEIKIINKIQIDQDNNPTNPIQTIKTIQINLQTDLLTINPYKIQQQTTNTTYKTHTIYKI